jgi:protocatechuate 3,4-dioxygenase beta subunit
MVTAMAALAGADQAVPSSEEEAPRTVTGRVVDSEGRPIPGVRIWTRQTEEEESRKAEPRPVAITGPDGTFTAQGVLSSSWPLVAACPPGWVYAEEIALAGSAELRLHPATRIAGRVIDRKGKPVAGVEIDIDLEGGPEGCARLVSYVPPPCIRGDQGVRGVTDVDGRFVFESLEPGWYEIGTREDAEETVRRRRGAPGQSIDGVEFVLNQSSSHVEGRVLDEAGEPVAGAQVSLSGARPSGTVETDAAGGFLLPAVLTGRNRLEVTHPDRGWLVQDVQVEDRPLRLDLRMSPATLLRGRITGAGGGPVQRPRLSIDYRPVEISKDGSFQLSVPPGEHDVQADADDLPTTRRRITAGNEPVDLKIRMTGTTMIRGRLTGLAPGNSAWISLKEETGELSFRADYEGRYQGSIPPGAWTLVARDSNRRSFERQIEAGEGETVTVEDIRFPPLPPVHGRVLDPTGRPMAMAEVSFLQKGETVQSRTNAEGSFVTWLSEGTWTVQATRSGFGPAFATVEASGDAPTEVPDLRLSRLVNVSGHILGVDPDVVVQFVLAEPQSLRTWTARSRVAPGNEFHLDGLWPGTWEVRTDVDGRNVKATLEIPPDAVEVQLDLNADLPVADAAPPR